VAVFLFPLVLFLMVRGYFSSNLFNEKNQKRDMVFNSKKFPPALNPLKEFLILLKELAIIYIPPELR